MVQDNKKLIWFIFLFAPLMYIFIGYMISVNKGEGASFDLLTLQDSKFLVTIFGLLVAINLFVFLLNKAKSKMNTESEKFTLLLIQLALAESIAVYGVSFFFANNIFTQLVVFALASFLIILSLKPKDQAL